MAACSERPGTLSIYVGHIGETHQVAMTVNFPDAQTIEAVYFDPTKRENTRLSGPLLPGDRFELVERSAKGAPRVFAGAFASPNPRSTSSHPGCSVLAGTFSDPNTHLSADFSLREIGSWYSAAQSLDHRYQKIGATDDRIVESGAQAFVDAVARGDKRAVADRIKFPVQVHFGSEQRSISDSSAFLDLYDEVFTSSFVEKIKVSRPYHMPIAWHGLAFLDPGLVFFDSSGRAVIINNAAARK